jgi:hypothetical protein
MGTVETGLGRLRGCDAVQCCGRISTFQRSVHGVIAQIMRWILFGGNISNLASHRSVRKLRVLRLSQR